MGGNDSGIQNGAINSPGLKELGKEKDNQDRESYEEVALRKPGT